MFWSKVHSPERRVRVEDRDRDRDWDRDDLLLRHRLPSCCNMSRALHSDAIAYIASNETEVRDRAERDSLFFWRLAASDHQTKFTFIKYSVLCTRYDSRCILNTIRLFFFYQLHMKISYLNCVWSLREIDIKFWRS